MKNISIIIAALLCIGLASCGGQRNREPNYQTVTIIDVNRPKHWKVKYIVDSTGEVRTASSKHCSTWRNLEIGKKYYLDINRTGCNITLQ